MKSDRRMRKKVGAQFIFLVGHYQEFTEKSRFKIADCVCHLT